ncbi:Late cornified envelope protein 1E [Cinnamomum micranthum f. kanehirae]|uniref:Late cornified envelope protein 1E n=1 Tax=Cinnamomum micranthum f. kanehirae TaxID=337451 RepID=A0A3S3QMD2_9MAGN|nr:Late cornified envelope protein 1E [Cinnamomum micranthum f. kanehirae]
MVDNPSVCCMCGDIGFPEKLFHCTRCRSRFQHSYCTNYVESLETGTGFCDWCRSEDRKAKVHGTNSKKSAGKDAGSISRSEYSGDKIKLSDREESSDRGKSAGSTASPRPGGRRYKLLKDVLC